VFERFSSEEQRSMAAQLKRLATGLEDAMVSTASGAT
jgi:hypothetical protein